MCQKLLIVLCVCYRLINGDVLNKINKLIRTLQPPYIYSNNNFPNSENNNNNNGVYVETTTEFFLPEIIVNRNIPQENSINLDFVLPASNSDDYDRARNYYVPPYPGNNLPEIIVNDDPPIINNAYLPPPQLTEVTTIKIPSWNYSTNQINNKYLPPYDNQYDEPINIPNPSVNYYLPPQYTNDRKPKGSVVDEQKNVPLVIELNELRCLPNQNGYFKAVLTVKNVIENPPIIEHESNDPRCSLIYIQSKIEINIGVEQFENCQVIQCSDNGQYLCMVIRFPQIKGMRSLNDAKLTLQCKIQDRIVTKTHALRLGVLKERLIYFCIIRYSIVV